MTHANVKLPSAAMPMLLALSLTGCAASSPTRPALSPPLPPPPSLTTPLPSVNYSLTAADAIRNWRQKQMATRLMSEPLSKPGQE